MEITLSPYANIINSLLLKYYLSSLKYPLNGEAIVPFALGTICTLVSLCLLKIIAYFIDFFYYGGVSIRDITNITSYAGLVVLYFLLAYLSNMVLTSSEGKDTLCDSPQFIDRFDDVVIEPGFRSSIVILTYIMPFLLSLMLDAWMISGILLLAGCFFLPMTYMRTCIMEDLEGMNPRTCLRFVANKPAAYMGLLLMSMAWSLGIILPPCFFIFLVYQLKGSGLGTIILFYILYAPFIFYITATYMNILGKFYRRHEEVIEGE